MKMKNDLSETRKWKKKQVAIPNLNKGFILKGRVLVVIVKHERIFLFTECNCNEIKRYYYSFIAFMKPICYLVSNVFLLSLYLQGYPAAPHS
jgi:hypothetical protein